jgi:hypothetical protein
MRRITVLLVLLAATFVHADEWNKTYNLTGRPTLRVSTSDAALRVSTWDRNTIEARVITEGYKIGEDGIRITEQQAGNTVDIQVRYPHHHGISINWGNRQVTVEITMPREGTANLQTGDGSIRLTGLKGDMDLNTGDGSIEAHDVDGNFKAHTGDGHITTVGRFDSLDLNTGDGRIDATAARDSKVSREWNVHTGDGSVTLRIPETLAADIDIHTSDGHIDFDVPITTSGRMATNTLRGKMNGGGPLLVVHTGDGSIHLERSL